jgi:hypothetical protein
LKGDILMKIRFAAFVFFTMLALCGTSAFAQSTNRDSPTPIGGTALYRGSVRDTNPGGSTAYFYSDLYAASGRGEYVGYFQRT